MNAGTLSSLCIITKRKVFNKFVLALLLLLCAAHRCHHHNPERLFASLEFLVVVQVEWCKPSADNVTLKTFMASSVLLKQWNESVHIHSSFARFLLVLFHSETLHGKSFNFSKSAV